MKNFIVFLVNHLTQVSLSKAAVNRTPENRKPKPFNYSPRKARHVPAKLKTEKKCYKKLNFVPFKKMEETGNSLEHFTSSKLENPVSEDDNSQLKNLEDKILNKENQEINTKKN